MRAALVGAGGGDREVRALHGGRERCPDRRGAARRSASARRGPGAPETSTSPPALIDQSVQPCARSRSAGSAGRPALDVGGGVEAAGAPGVEGAAGQRGDVCADLEDVRELGGRVLLGDLAAAVPAGLAVREVRAEPAVDLVEPGHGVRDRRLVVARAAQVEGHDRAHHRLRMHRTDESVFHDVEHCFGPLARSMRFLCVAHEGRRFMWMRHARPTSSVRAHACFHESSGQYGRGGEGSGRCRPIRGATGRARPTSDAHPPGRGRPVGDRRLALAGLPARPRPGRARAAVRRRALQPRAARRVPVGRRRGLPRVATAPEHRRGRPDRLRPRRRAPGGAPHDRRLLGRARCAPWRHRHGAGPRRARPASRRLADRVPARQRGGRRLLAAVADEAFGPGRWVETERPVPGRPGVPPDHFIETVA